MMKTKLFKTTLFLLLLVAALNEFGTIFYLYWTTKWFDMITHFLGGATAGLGVILFFVYILKKQNVSRRQIIWIGIVGTFVIGILWEVYELSFGITSFSDGMYYVLDTSKDITMDMLGGILGSLYAAKQQIQIDHE